MERIIRLAALKLFNIKNVRNGEIVMPHVYRKEQFCKKAEVLGIYGQNGSGKTAIIDTLYYLQQIMIGRTIPNEFAEYVDVKSNQAEIVTDFHISNDSFLYEVSYRLVIKRREKGIEIAQETWQKKVTVLIYLVKVVEKFFVEIMRIILNIIRL